MEGRIFASDGKTPVEGAIVRATRLDDGDVIAAAPSDRRGRFRIANIRHGWVDVVVETPAGLFVADRVVELRPEGKIGVEIRLTRFDERSGDYWASRRTGGAVLPVEDPVGLAEGKEAFGGKDFWRSPPGVAIIAGSAGVVLLVIAASSKASNGP